MSIYFLLLRNQILQSKYLEVKERKRKIWKERNAIYLSMNSSIGGIIMADGKVYTGNSNKAGEVGHIQLVQNGKKCYCGNCGCFDAYCNTLNLREKADGQLDQFFEKIDRGEKEYLEYWEEYKDYFASALFSIRIMLDCVIVIGGELGKYADYYLEDIRDRVDKKTFFPGEYASEYIFAHKEGEYAIAVGAAMYYIEKVLDEEAVFQKELSMDA